MNEAEPTLAELIRRALDSRLCDVHVSMPGIVVSYDATRKTAQVQPALRRVILDTEENRTEEEIPPIENVPVDFPGAASLTSHFNLAAGDTGTLVFSTNSTSEFQSTGRVGAPGSLKLHDLGSPVFRPHPWTANAPADTDESIGKPGGLRLKFKTATIEVGTGAQFVALAALVLAEFTKLQAALLTGSNSGGPVVFGTAYAAPSTVAASNLKADP